MNSFTSNLLKNLEAEITQLGNKITKTRESQGNSSEYKNLIQAYKEIVEIYHKVKDDIKSETGNKITCNENGTVSVENIDIRQIKRNIDETIQAINSIQDIPEEIVKDVKIFLKDCKINSWEVRKELTLINHLFFINGSLQTPGVNYIIDKKIIKFHKDEFVGELWNFRIVWLDENNSKEEVKHFETSEVVLLNGEKKESQSYNKN